MTRKPLLILAALCLLAGSPAATARAAGGTAVLEAAPGDAWAVVTLRNLVDLDRKFTNLSLEINAPWAGMSVLALAKAQLGLFAGLDDAGGAAVVFLPAPSLEAVTNRMAILLPVTDYAQLLSMMTPEDAGGGLSKVALSGQPSFMAQKGGFAVVGPTAEVVKAVLAAKAPLASRMTPYQRELCATADVVAWGNVKTLTEVVVKPLAAGADPEAGSPPQLRYLEDLDSVLLWVTLSTEGITIGFHEVVGPEGELAKVLASLKAVPAPLLAGLPAGSFVLAAGGVASPEAGAYAARTIDRMFAEMSAAGGSGAAQWKALAALARDVAAGTRRYAFAVNATEAAEAAAGVVAANLVLEVDGGSDALLNRIRATITDLRARLSPEGLRAMDGMVLYKPKAENGAIDHLRLIPAGLGMDVDATADVTKVLGADGLLLRLGPAGERHVVVTLGGGLAQMSRVAALAREGQAPLAGHPEIRAGTSGAPAERTAEAFLSFNGLLKMAGDVARVTGAPPPPHAAAVERPVALFSRVVPGPGAETRVLVPTGLLKAVVQMSMAMMGGPPPGGPPGEPGMQGE